MTSNPGGEMRPLPQCGFKTDINFDTLVESNHFLFRVYTPKERSPFSDDTDPFFVAPKFDELFARSPVDIPDVKFPETNVGSYAEVVRHMEWTTRHKSPYISTSFSFSWAIWEAVGRYHSGMKKDVEIAIIDASALGGRAATAVQLLRKSSKQERDEQYRKWYRFSQDSQSVLVYGMVPRPAVLASIPLLQILRKMPSYFLRKDIQIISGNPLDQAAWDYSNRKSTYRHFCQDMSKVFFSRTPAVRLRDSTAGAVRLALSFLRPFFHRVVQDDHDLAVSYLRTLAATISQWPGDIWVQDHPEVRYIVDSMALALGEELREKYSLQRQEEISNLRVVITGLEEGLHTCDVHALMPIEEDIEVDSDGDFELELEDSDEPTLITVDIPQAVKCRPYVETTSVTIIPRTPISFQTPITPPESPRDSMFTVSSASIPFPRILPTLVPGATHEPEAPGISPSKNSSGSEELASPPLTPPPRAPVFLPPENPSLGYDQSPASRGQVDLDEILSEDESEKHGIEEYEEHAVSAALGDEGLSDGASERDAEEIAPLGPAFVLKQGGGDGEETSHLSRVPFTMKNQEQETPPQSPQMSWVAISPNSMYSPRASICSIDTLCEPELPFKRGSVGSISYPEPFGFLRRLSSPPVEVQSRTISFSGTSAMVSGVSPVDPIRLPLPRSPTLSIDTLSTLSSSSSTSPCPLVELPSPTLPSPTDPLALIVPPKGRISLLSPFGEDEMQDSEVTATEVADTASYLVTGFLVGAFITLFLFSTQRRTQLYFT